MSTPYYGKYRGKVANPIDPLGLGRIQVEVPAVYGDGTLNWAMPCAPYAGPGVGFFVIPPKDANIWVEFEAGDIDSPIWSGCFWATGEASFPSWVKASSPSPRRASVRPFRCSQVAA